MSIMSNNIVSMYRGLDHYPENEGWSRDGILWLTEDIEYAREYGDFVMEYKLLEDAVRTPSMEEMEEILGRDVSDELLDGLSGHDRRKLLEHGYNSVYFSTDSADILMLFDRRPIVSCGLIR